jgi:hypothetical protein
MTIYQVMEIANGKFPFWATNRDPRHYCALVKEFGFYSVSEETNAPRWTSADINDAFVRNTYSHAFLCDLYTLDKSKRLKRDVLIPGHNTPDWLPC